MSCATLWPPSDISPRSLKRRPQCRRFYCPVLSASAPATRPHQRCTVVSQQPCEEHDVMLKPSVPKTRRARRNPGLCGGQPARPNGGRRHGGAALIVRNATVGDIPEMAAMVRALHAENPRLAFFEGKIVDRFRDPFSEETIEEVIRSRVSGTLLADPVGGALVAEKGGMLIGILSGVITSPHFSDYTCYVVPEHRRRGRATGALIRAFEAWVEEQDMRHDQEEQINGF